MVLMRSQAQTCSNDSKARRIARAAELLCSRCLAKADRLILTVNHSLEGGDKVVSIVPDLHKVDAELCIPARLFRLCTLPTAFGGFEQIFRKILPNRLHQSLLGSSE